MLKRVALAGTSVGLVVAAVWFMGGKLLFFPTQEVTTEQAAQTLQDNNTNSTSSSQSAINFGISSIPCVIVFKDGKIAAKHTGLINQKQLESLVSKHLEELATT